MVTKVIQMNGYDLTLVGFLKDFGCVLGGAIALAGVGCLFSARKDRRNYADDLVDIAVEAYGGKPIEDTSPEEAQGTLCKIMGEVKLDISVKEYMGCYFPTYRVYQEGKRVGPKRLVHMLEEHVPQEWREKKREWQRDYSNSLQDIQEAVEASYRAYIQQRDALYAERRMVFFNQWLQKIGRPNPH